MDVVRRLGKRYLWVDQYCIDQKNKDVKARQILHMDQIYEGAYATIVAGSGFGAEFGLPGVANRHRSVQLRAETPTMTLVATPLSLKGDLVRGGWIGRAWTYQEAVLSRRLIVFAEHQAHFVCMAMTCSEAVLTGADDIRIGQGEQPISLHMGYFSRALSNWEPTTPPTDQTPFRQLLAHIQAFSDRKLSFQSDRLNALRGILSRWPFYSYYGVPFAADIALGTEPAASTSPHYRLGFLHTLFWSPVSSHCSRNTGLGFPSWSWASWPEEVWFEPPEHVQGEVSLPMANIHVKGLSGRLEPDPTITNTHSRILPELVPELQLETLVIQLRFQHLDHRLADGAVALCHCHPSSEHGGSILPGVGMLPLPAPMSDTPGPGWAYACFDGDLEPPRETITQRPWDCVLLFTGPGQRDAALRQRAFLIVEWKGAVAYRVGRMLIRDNALYRFDTVMRNTPQEIKMITLG
jgi:hypothetical protein